METPVGSLSPRPKSGAHERHDRARALQGHRAGFVSRLAADTVDVITVVFFEFGLILLVAAIRYLFTRRFAMPSWPTWVTLGVFWLISLIYLTSGWATTGKTIGKQVAGVRVVRADGSPLRAPKAFVRALMYAVFPAGLVWCLFSRRNASLQDLLTGSVVVYDWSYRAPDQPA